MGYGCTIRLLSLTVGLLLSCVCVAQERVVVNEDFSTNDRFWFVGDKGYIAVTMKKGSYAIDRRVVSGEDIFIIDNFIDPAKDFSIETTLLMEEAMLSSSAGLVWNYADMNNFDAFVLSGEGSFKVIAVRYGEMFDVSESFITHDAIKKVGKKNTLKVQRKGDSCLFFINEQHVFTSQFPGLSYTAHGVYVLKKTKCNYSSFVVRQTQQINVLEEFQSKKKSLGPNVNSPINDSAPLISPDGSKLFFSREIQGAHNSDIWVATRTKEGEWSKAVSIGAPLNNKVFNSVISCSPDNKSVLLLNTYAADGSYKGCCFSISDFNGSTWSVPRDAVIENLNGYGKWLDASLSVDNSTMLLSIQRPGSLGYNDLYVSFYNDLGRWQEPINLGPSINTIFNEAAPFLAADNKTLYFCSTGYPGYGNQDIFMSRRLDDSWTNWSTPVNLGPTVNSVGFDAFFSIAANDATAYLVSNAQSIGGTDLFSIDLPEALTPQKVCLLTGKVVDNKTNEPLEAQIIYCSLRSDKVKGTVFSDTKTGNFQLILQDIDSYYISAEKKGYYAQADSIAFSEDGKQSLKQQLVIRLDPLVVGKALPIRQLYFEKTKAVFLPTSFPALENLCRLMKQNPKMKIEIVGHTDNVGDPALNQELSVQRAEAVAMYLQQRGINRERMAVHGYGGTKPVADNSKEETRRLNRRVEFTVIEF
ncbi:MAG: yiaD [Cytophagaceae bacterium]|jgi:outer membrane protein OmpA-like peptidoglycan-associated protein|nr:yiaD [Cytophagaceae bacterium]